MVGYEDDEQVLPLWQLLQFIDEIADAGIKIVEGIGYLLVEFLQRHIPWLVGAEGGEAEEVSLMVSCGIDGGNLLVECGESDVISHAPFSRVLLLTTIVGFPGEFLPASGDEKASHIGEVDVATI